MAKGEDTDDHHFLPQFYLRPWLSETDLKLVEYGRVPPTMEIRCRRWVTTKTGYVPNLYTLPGVTEDTKQNVEKVFNQEIDTSAATVRDKLLQGVHITEEERAVWARFLLWLGIRNPTEMSLFKDRIYEDFMKPDAKTEAIWARIRKEGMPETAAEALLLANPSVRELAAILVPTKLAQNQNVIRTMMNMDWMVYDAQTANRRFLTCDRPLIMTSGLGGPNGHMAIPISPDKLFIIAKPAFNDALLDNQPSAVVAGVNQVIIAQAREKVYGVDKTYLDEVRAGMSSGDYFSLAAVPG
ncbi:DUF4238 domain-containing protein [Rhizobium ruizarguesonis]|uniref:DUF4238 domain-containing protein n=1 Tax=Rhizobium ruizarguesonis TaxID=2081791 RepID=UPI001031FC06|nr:DUF4238 domain-containing protein [Rhizobium ruizarguesonis]TBB81026.1 DUF4238 domain-containing protein [Rhizobium ruizarguesonis]TBC40053.1 DUF4238 domain-containing protein [Rhizobium ruizarguesonis]